MFRPTNVAQNNSNKNKKYCPISQSTVFLCQSHIPTVSTDFQCYIRGSNVFDRFLFTTFFSQGTGWGRAGIGVRI